MRKYFTGLLPKANKVHLQLVFIQAYQNKNMSTSSSLTMYFMCQFSRPVANLSNALPVLRSPNVTGCNPLIFRRIHSVTGDIDVMTPVILYDSTSTVTF